VLERWLAPKGFGFIRPDDRGKPNGGLFVDLRDIPALERGEEPREGQPVSYGMGRDRGDGRRHAVDVHLIGS
jgi:cold shock CspA family protein